MLVKKEQRKEKQIAKDGIVWEYHLPSKTIGFALSKLNGRVPDSGWMRNKVCNEIYYVIAGSGTLFVEDKKYKLEEGDVFLIEPGKKFYVIAKNLHLALPTSPAWYPEQWENIKD
jgi:mannose-6-phosphate isomerase-like protein (cupin superfamily)